MSSVHTILLLAGLLVCSATASAGAGQLLLQRGEQIAEDRCSACHVVAQNQEYPVLLKQPTPSFRSIADRPQVSEEALRRFVATTHWDLKTVPISMPDPQLSRAESTAVIRYILSLRKK